MNFSPTPEGQRMRTFHDAERVLATALPGYESRPPQQQLAQAIEQIFAMTGNFEPYRGPEDEYRDWVRPGITHCLGQAGCGTGKSLAYLIPAILSGRRVVVSVTTKALQDQIVSTDLPFLQEHLGVNLSWALLKGRSNYLCTNRLQIADGEQEILRALWVATQDPTFDGLRESVEIDIPDRIWAQVASESEECSGNCKAEECYAERARRMADQAQLVIANHALFFTDLIQKSYGRNGMLNEYDLVVFDEAHALEEVAANTIGSQVTENSFNSLTTEARNWGRDFGDDEGQALAEPIIRVTQAAERLFAGLQVGRMKTPQLEALVEELGDLYDALDMFSTAVKNTSIDRASDYEKASKKKWRIRRGVISLLERLGEIVAAPQTEVVRWVEEVTRKGQTRKLIRIAPIKVSPFLYRWLFSKTPSILVSATLMVKGSMSYVAGRFGIDGEGVSYGSIDVGTPFDFQRQGRLYVPLLTPSGTAFPLPAGDTATAWEQAAIHEIHRLATASRGRALVLFTSIKHMRMTYEHIQHLGGDLTYRMQGERGVSNRDLVDWLKDHQSEGPGRVLFGTKSFFTGIDIPGEALSLLVITKMPFPVPTEPLNEARCEAIEAAGGEPFQEFTIPVMSLELQQGVGRLIRHRNDTGVAAILDPRLVNKGYGKRILRDLPPMPQAFKLDEIQSFFEHSASEPAPA